MCYQQKAVYRDPNEAVPDRGLARDGLHINNQPMDQHFQQSLSSQMWWVLTPEDVEGKMEEGEVRGKRYNRHCGAKLAATTIAITYSPPNATNKSDISCLETTNPHRYQYLYTKTDTPTDQPNAKPHVQNSQRVDMTKINN